MTATGRWAAPITSRMTPPTPVLAPPNGSTADGWLWVSALRATVVPSLNDTMPALPTNADRTNGAATVSVASRSWSSSDGSVGPVVDGDRGAERLVGAVLAPRLGQRLQLDVGRVAAGGLEVGLDGGELLRVEGQRPLDAERGERVGVEAADRRSSRRRGRSSVAGVEHGRGGAGASSAR